MKFLSLLVTAVLLLAATSTDEAGADHAASAALTAVARRAVLQHDSTAGGVGVAQTTAAPLLLTLLKNLRSEAEASIALQGSMSEWCRDARAQKTGLADSLQRQFEEANNEMRQVALDSRRLSSEVSLVNSTTQQKKQQLKDAALTVKVASAEFAGEKEQLQTLLAAAEHALQLVDVQTDGNDGRDSGGGGRDLNSELVSNLAQLQRMADAGQGEAYAGGGGAAAGEGFSLSSLRTHQLRQSLVRLRDQLREALSSSKQEEQEMAQKHWIFADHLNSSLMEIQSQIAAINMQTAQRKREHIRLETRAGDLKVLLTAIASSRAATDAACMEEEKQRSEISQHIKAESIIVKSMLKQAPSEGLMGQGELGKGTPSFLQVQLRSLSSSHAVQRAVDDLASLAHRFPQEANLYDEGARQLRGGLRVGGSGAAGGSGATPGSVGAGAMEGGSAADANSALSNIKRFVAANNNAGSQASHLAQGLRQHDADGQHASADEVGGLYSGLLERVRVKEQAVADQRSRCAALLRDAAVDHAALARSLKRVDSKAKIAKAMSSEYEQTQAYDNAQANQISSFLERLSHLSKEAVSLNTRTGDNLAGHAEELMALATDLGQQPSGDEQHTAQMVRTLAQKVDGHRMGLVQQRGRWQERREAVEVADNRLLKLLQADANRNRRRLTRLQAEAQLLSGLAYAKANDRELSARYQEISIKLCSMQGMSNLYKKDRELQREEQVLQASAAGDQPSATPQAAAAQ